jgi:WD40 repeat protein
MKNCCYTLIILVICFIVLGVFWVGCGDETKKGVGPIPAADYEVHFQNGGRQDWFYSYHPLSNDIDSFYLPCQARREMTVSTDGKNLFVRLAHSIAVVDLDSQTVVQELPYSGTPIPSPDGQWLAVAGPDFYLLRTENYSVAYHDTIRTYSGSFSANSERFYGISETTVEGPREVRSIDIENEYEVSTLIATDCSITQVIPAPDESILYVYCYTGICMGAFGVYEIEADTMIFWHSFTPGMGEMAMTPGGNHVFYTNPGPWIDIQGCPLPPNAFFRYDASTNEIVEISTDNILDEFEAPFLWTNELTITPDGLWLVAAGAGGLGILLTWDIKAEQFIHHLKFYSINQLLSLTCQASR